MQMPARRPWPPPLPPSLLTDEEGEDEEGEDDEGEEDGSVSYEPPPPPPLLLR